MAGISNECNNSADKNAYTHTVTFERQRHDSQFTRALGQGTFCDGTSTPLSTDLKKNSDSACLITLMVTCTVQIHDFFKTADKLSLSSVIIFLVPHLARIRTAPSHDTRSHRLVEAVSVSVLTYNPESSFPSPKKVTSF